MNANDVHFLKIKPDFLIYFYGACLFALEYMGVEYVGVHGQTSFTK